MDHLIGDFAMTNFWAIKIAALLHDPPAKVVGLEDHRRRAFVLMEQVFGANRFEELFGYNGTDLTGKQFEATLIGARVKKADSVASAIDRAAFPRSINMHSEDYVRSALIKHPLCGREIALCSVRAASGNEAAVIKLLQTNLDKVASPDQDKADLRRSYLRLWRNLPETVSDAGIRLLPPDTRIVDHALWQHLDATAALATALPQPSLLVFSIGPVQSFIAEARRTQDMWIGSYLLSYLTWSAIRVIVEEAGPDAVLYPALRGQPLMDHWLFIEHLRDEKPDPLDLAIATIPNKFLALLPATQAEVLAKKATNEVRRTWRKIASKVKENFPRGSPGITWEQIWARQVEADDWPEVYWSILPWPDIDEFSNSADEAKAVLEFVENYLETPSLFRSTLEVYEDAWPTGINSGTLYGRLHALSQRGFDARKGLRDCLQVTEDGEKCTVSGMRSALRVDVSSTRQALRLYWQNVAEALREEKHRYYDVKPDGSERLSAVVAVKRFAQRSYFDSELHIKGSFPSTTRVAAAPFYISLLGKLAHNRNLQKALETHLTELAALNFPRLSEEASSLSMPYLTTRVQSEQARKLLYYDADVLFEETFRPKRLEKDYRLTVTQSQADRAANSCRELQKEAQKADCAVPRPPNYYAILMLDGDEMGKWLYGNEEKMPLLRDAFHPNIPALFTENNLKNAYLEQRLQQKGESISMYVNKWQRILNSTRPMSAALHNAISSALANFALRFVRQVVEQRYPGRVVYAGGDDVLAILPVQYALVVARELRALFSGEARIIPRGDAWDVEPKFCDPNCTGFLEIGDEILLTMGPRASASVGIAIVHHMQPLDSALEAAREATRAAKEDYGRNAIVINFLRRSGERRRIGSKWYYDGDVRDPLLLVEKIRMYFADRRIARGFAYSLYEKAYTLTALPNEAQRAELRRLLDRHRDNKRISFQEIDELADHMVKWAAVLQTHCQRTDAKEKSPAPGIVELSQWVQLGRFLSQGGEE